MEAPQWVPLGGQALLRCRYSVQFTDLHQVAWFRNMKKIFNFIKGRKPAFTNHTVTGAEIDVSTSACVCVCVCVNLLHVMQVALADTYLNHHLRNGYVSGRKTDSAFTQHVGNPFRVSVCVTYFRVDIPISHPRPYHHTTAAPNFTPHSACTRGFATARAWPLCASLFCVWVCVFACVWVCEASALCRTERPQRAAAVRAVRFPRQI
ncbi:hypothetical protein ONE63_004914 [Megalurothrips usitatus]|uniref:Uncharacterized protein n=1 Tax=Megalurothrips usitatus TaxID=439358 RepID=A0AAV7X811_9NEOP|nr:hypothetical protein ONE63_004914 [Megalurothrips usitatus]